MTKKNLDKFHISYDLDPKTHDIKLTFSQGEHQCVVNWYDKEENSWEEVVNFCSRLEDVLHECGSENFHINWPIHRIIIVVGGFEFYDGYVFILDPNTKTIDIEGMEWVQREKLCGKFKVEPLDLIKEFYYLMLKLYDEPEYDGINANVLNKLYYLSRDIKEKEKKQKKSTRK